MSHPSSLYQLAKNWAESFSKQSQWVLTCQRDPSTGIYGYKVSNVNRKSKISVFQLAFFLLYIIWIPISVSNLLHFSRIILNQITENIDIYTENVWTFYQAMAQNECTKREKTRKVRFMKKTFICLENVIKKFARISHNLMEKKKQGGATNMWKASNVDAKKFFCVLRNILDFAGEHPGPTNFRDFALMPFGKLMLLLIPCIWNVYFFQFCRPWLEGSLKNTCSGENLLVNL